MKQVYSSNIRSNRIRSFGAISILLNFLLLFALSLQVEKLPLWIVVSIFIIVFFVILMGLYKSNNIPMKIDINEFSFIFYYPLSTNKKYKLDDLSCYATGSYGGVWSGSYHSIIFEFRYGSRIAVPSFRIKNYTELLDFMKNSNFEYFGYIGQNRWHRKNKPLSKKWVIAREEKELELEIEKDKALFTVYFGIIMSIIMNITILYVLFFQN